MGLQEGRKGGVGGVRLLAGAVSVAVVAVVVAALWIAGSPASERSRRIDNQRLSDLQTISYAADAYYVRTGALPESLEALSEAEPEGFGITRAADPVTETPYEYLVKDGATYSLCATFDMPSEDAESQAARPVTYPLGSKEWSHPAGDYCFTMNTEVRTGKVSCSLTNPCSAGQSCVVLPGKQGASCVPVGKECLAAGCSGACTIAESYPAQVTCTENIR